MGAQTNAPAHWTPSRTPQAQGYWCVVCGRWLPADPWGVIVHDAIAHPPLMTFDDEAHPQ